MASLSNYLYLSAIVAIFACASAKSYSIVALSDGPYGYSQVADLPRVIHEVNKMSWKLGAVVHLGDIKAGGDKCNNTYFNMVKRDYFDHIKVPLLYTPGDNEWTDCHRKSNDQYNPLERLQTIRTTFFHTLGKTTGSRSPMTVESQAIHAGFSDFVENQMWQMEAVVMGTVHIVGSNNNRAQWDQLKDGDETDARVAEYMKRDEAAIYWIEKIFERAKMTQAEGVLLFVHGNMWPNWELAHDKPLYGFDRIAQALSMYASKFDKPVWLLNGDTHDFASISPFTPGATHPTTKFYGKPDVNIYRIHGEEYDAPKFRAITTETADKYDSAETDEDYNPDLIFELTEIKIHPGMGDDVFELVRHRFTK